MLYILNKKYIYTVYEAIVLEVVSFVGVSFMPRPKVYSPFVSELKRFEVISDICICTWERDTFAE